MRAISPHVINAAFGKLTQTVFDSKTYMMKLKLIPFKSQEALL